MGTVTQPKLRAFALTFCLLCSVIAISLAGGTAIAESAPVFNSGNHPSFAEMDTGTVIDVNADDGDGGSNDEGITYSLVGGADRSSFVIDPATGELSFQNPSNYEVPTDSDESNDYVVDVEADDGSQTTTQTITVEITDRDGQGTSHTLGGTETDGALKIDIESGNIALFRYDGSSWVYQYYSQSSSDTAVHAGGTVYDKPGGGTANPSTDGELQLREQYTTNGGDTVVTEYDDPGSGVTLVQRVTYSGSNQYHDMSWDVRNVPDGAGDISDIQVLHGADTYLAGGDSGIGFYDSDTNTVGVKKGPENFSVSAENRLELRGLSTPDGYISQYYGDVSRDLADGDMPDSVDSDPHDNGYGMEWERGSALGDGEAWTVDARESLTLSTVITTGPGTKSHTGDSTDLTFDVENVVSSSETVSYTTDGPSGWTVTTPSDRTISGGNTVQETVTVTPPDSVSGGQYEVTLTSTPDGGSPSSATATIDVPFDPPTFNSGSNPSFVEGTTGTVIDVNAEAGSGNDTGITYSIVGGTDQSAFSIDSDNGELKFNSAPDYENPTDSDTNNDYVVEVEADDGQETATQIITVDVIQSNNAPTISTDIRTLDAIGEDDTNNGGTSVAAVLSSAGTTGDQDGDTLGVAITSVDDTDGTWQYSTDGSWNDITAASPSDGSALLLAGDDSIRFVPNSNFSGTASGSVHIRAWDQTSGSGGDTDASTSGGGGTTAYSSTTTAIEASVNDAPEVSSITRGSPMSQETNSESVSFQATFSEATNGLSVPKDDLVLTGDSDVTSEASIDGVTGSGDTRTITITEIAGDGTLGFKIDDNDNIENGNSVPLGGVGSDGEAGDGSYTSGETYTIDNTAPTAEAGPDQSVDENTNVSFDATSSTDDNTINNYSWDFGDDTTSSGATVNHVYSDSGTYTVTLTVTDDAGNTASDSLTVTVTTPRGGGGGGSASESPRTTEDGETTVTVEGDTTEEERGDGEGDGATDDEQASDMTVTVERPRPGQTLVIEGRSASIQDGTGDAGDGSAQDESGDDSQDDSDDSRAGNTGSNVRSDRLAVEVDTTRSFELSITTYENDLTRSAATRGDAPPTSIAGIPPRAGGMSGSRAFAAVPQVDDTLAPVEVQEAADSFEDETGTVSAGYVEINHTLDPEEVVGATFEFSIRRSYLAELGVDPEGVGLYHQTDDDEWVVEQTEHIGNDSTYYRFEGTMPGFSVFALGTGAPQVEVTAASLSEPTVEVGEEAIIDATVENRGRSTVEKTVELTLDGEVLDDETVSLDGGATEEVTLSFSPERVDEYDLMVGTIELEPLGTQAAEDEQTDPNAGVISDGPSWLVIVGVVVLCGLLAVVLLLRRRKKKTDHGDGPWPPN